MTHQMVLRAGKQFRVVRVDLRQASISVLWKRADGSRIGTLAAANRDQPAAGPSLLFATNGGIFSPAYVPLGLLIEAGHERVPLNDNDGVGNFFLKPNGVFSIRPTGARVEPSKGFRNDAVSTAVQSGPMLAINGAVNSQFAVDSSNRTIRSGVGVSSTGDVVFVLSTEPVTFFETASLFHDFLDCPNALFLDGGISKFYVRGIDAPDAGQQFATILAVTGRSAAIH